VMVLTYNPRRQKQEGRKFEASQAKVAVSKIKGPEHGPTGRVLT
jgi:hypothetical protein